MIASTRLVVTNVHVILGLNCTVTRKVVKQLVEVFWINQMAPSGHLPSRKSIRPTKNVSGKSWHRKITKSLWTSPILILRETLSISRLPVNMTHWQFTRRCPMTAWRSTAFIVAANFPTQSQVKATFSVWSSNRTRRFRRPASLPFTWPMLTNVLKIMAAVNMSVAIPLVLTSVHVTMASHFTKTDMIVRKAVASLKFQSHKGTFHRPTTPTCIQHRKIAFGTSQQRQVIE